MLSKIGVFARGFFMSPSLREQQGGLLMPAIFGKKFCIANKFMVSSSSTLEVLTCSCFSVSDSLLTLHRFRYLAGFEE